MPYDEIAFLCTFSQNMATADRKNKLVCCNNCPRVFCFACIGVRKVRNFKPCLQLSLMISNQTLPYIGTFWCLDVQTLQKHGSTA